ncbi:PREDICTED: cytochrome b5-like [Lupinus angustifolius]|nr:PREDICTED: cytochrome b5-like [Lupinus angustifolius]XP_019459776.1 PREDICTED: cytochrome b5-like [Lupinus angustifolius]XP_019459777.1 PREDICTED: cytochrome b5-like [Lupinus angustifolius]
MAPNSKVYTFDEVAKHNHKKDCWIVVHGKVYDVTPFLDDHPGGDEPLLMATGKDATIDFEDIGHSDTAIEDMQQYYVGEIDTNTFTAKVDNSTPVTPPTGQVVAFSASNESSSFILKVLQYLLPLLILGFAYALQYYGKGSEPSES